MSSVILAIEWCSLIVAISNAGSFKCKLNWICWLISLNLYFRYNEGRVQRTRLTVIVASMVISEMKTETDPAKTLYQ